MIPRWRNAERGEMSSGETLFPTYFHSAEEGHRRSGKSEILENQTPVPRQVELSLQVPPSVQVELRQQSPGVLPVSFLRSEQVMHLIPSNRESKNRCHKPPKSAHRLRVSHLLPTLQTVPPQHIDKLIHWSIEMMV